MSQARILGERPGFLQALDLRDAGALLFGGRIEACSALFQSLAQLAMLYSHS